MQLELKAIEVHQDLWAKREILALKVNKECRELKEQEDPLGQLEQKGHRWSESGHAQY